MVIKKISNVSKFWKEIDSDIPSYHIAFAIGNSSSKKILNENIASFLHDYILITLKYGILIPIRLISNSISNINIEIERILKMQENVNMEFCFNQLYLLNDDCIYSCLLYTQRDDGIIKIENIVNTDLLYTYTDILKGKDAYGEAVKIYFLNNEFHIFNASDALLFSLFNTKTNFDTIDNSDTAYLNTTRYNSFLRDFLLLCYKYGATEVLYDNFDDSRSNNGIEHYSKKGILCNNEIIYYENVYDLIPVKYRYKLFEEISLDFNMPLLS